MLKSLVKRGGFVKLTKNSVVRLEITDINNLGYGVAKHGNMVVFVSGGVDGDVCDVKLIKVNKNYCVGIVEALIIPSEHRTSPSCERAVACGGCSYQSISYEHELQIKKRYVESVFKKAGLSEVKVNDTVSNGATDGYRNKAQYPIGMKNGEYTIGFYAPKSHRVVDVEHCTLAPALFSRICKQLKAFFAKYQISVYDEQNGTGVLRHVYLRASASLDSVMLCLVVNAGRFPYENELVSFARESLPEVTTLLVNTNTQDTNVVLGDEYTCLFGEGYVKDTLCGVPLEISPAAFYQVNHDMAELIYKKAAELARLGGGECVYDLYCGIGSIGLSMADLAGSIVGVDIEPSAIECAERNARAKNIKNARFLCADASRCEDLFESVGITGKIEDSVVIFDPPRKGSSQKLISDVCKREPKRVVYISCNPDTLARDSVYFRECGYKNYEITPYDLFPRTGHVECITVFEKVK